VAVGRRATLPTPIPGCDGASPWGLDRTSLFLSDLGLRFPRSRTKRSPLPLPGSDGASPSKPQSDFVVLNDLEGGGPSPPHQTKSFPFPAPAERRPPRPDRALLAAVALGFVPRNGRRIEQGTFCRGHGADGAAALQAELDFVRPSSTSTTSYFATAGV
jgi:hypothetical protein